MVAMRQRTAQIQSIPVPISKAVLEALNSNEGSTEALGAEATAEDSARTGASASASASARAGAGNARGKTYNAKNSVEIGNRYKLGISEHEPYIAPVPVKKPVKASSLNNTKNYYQNGKQPCYNCSDSHERDPVYYEPWHQKFKAPSIDNAPHRSGNVYTPKTFE